MIALDTNVLSEGFKRRPDPRVIEWLGSVKGEVVITAVTLAEILSGVRRLPEGRRKVLLAEVIDAALRPFRDSGAVLAFDEVAADHYADILLIRERSGLPISTADAQIAAICRSRGATCATRNTKDFAHTGVKLLDPWGF